MCLRALRPRCFRHLGLCFSCCTISFQTSTCICSCSCRRRRRRRRRCVMFIYVSVDLGVEVGALEPQQREYLSAGACRESSKEMSASLLSSGAPQWLHTGVSKHQGAVIVGSLGSQVTPQYTMYSIPYTTYHILCAIYHITYTLCHIRYNIYSVPRTIYHVLYTIYSRLYILYHTSKSRFGPFPCSRAQRQESGLRPASRSAPRPPERCGAPASVSDPRNDQK